MRDVPTSLRLKAGLSLSAFVVMVGGVWGIREAFPLASLIAAGGLIWSTRELGAWLLASVIVAVGGISWYYDAFLVAALVASMGLAWSRRDAWRWPLAAAVMAVGLLWSSLDQSGCSAWSRARIVSEKLAGNLSYLAWTDILRNVVTPCVTLYEPDPRIAKTVIRLDQKTVDGHNLELYQTDLGRFWIPAPGRLLLTFLLWELTVQHDYESGEVTIHPGDTVIDCGAHVGTFTRLALRRGASRVIAVEPDPSALACLEANFSRDISDGRIVVVREGVWDKPAFLTLSEHPEVDSGANSFLVGSPNHRIEGMRVVPVDDIVSRLHLEQVDFIKMDIEGAERHALQGAQQTLMRFKPRMAICAYHLPDDWKVIPALVKKIQPQYEVRAKDVDPYAQNVSTKVLFFY